jgi:predicted Fe-Mo cluster-binding NifX family protein
MKVCFPMNVNEGLQSTIFGHFSSAPLFLVVDSESREIEVIENCDPEAPLQGCNPFSALQGKTLDAIIVEGIGDAALQTMNMCGFRVYSATTSSLEQALEDFENQKLEEMVPFYSQYEGRCGDDNEDDGCDHHHHDEDEAPDENCIHHGGSGCSNHVEGSCTPH